jgi:PAS domain S-box-containing protein
VTGVSTPSLAGASAATAGHEPVLAVLDLMPDAILALDASGRIVLCNRTASSVFGVSAEQAAGLPVSELVPALAHDGIAKAMADAIVAGGGRIRIARLQTDGARRDGTPFPLEASIAESHAVVGARWTCVVRDLTEQRQAEAMLSLFSQAVDSSASGIVITSARLPGNPITYVNPAFTRITGYASHEAVGRNCAFLQGRDRDQPAIGALRDAIRDGRSQTVTLRNYRRDGTLFWNELHITPVRDPDGTVRHYLGVQIDVTARAEAERELAMRNARLDAVMSLSPDGFVLFDATGRLVYVNEALTGMLGVEAAGLAGLTREAFEVRLVAACAPADCDMPDAPRAAPESGQRTLELVRPQRRVLQCTERTHAGHGGETVLCFRDVTRETEIDRMKSEFLTTAAHELRTPLASVFGYAELLIAREFDAPKRQRMLKTIHAQAKLLTSMIDDLLDLAKIEARRGREAVLYPVPLGMLVDGALEGLAAVEAPREVEVDIEAGGRAVEVAVDPDRTRQAITSVLSNACRYSAPGSPVRLAVRTVAGPDGPTVVVAVTDHGIGMSAEQCARAFERFYRADPSGHLPGTGLGLSIAKEVLELQGGAISLRSEPGVGTEVQVRLRVAPPDMLLPDRGKRGSDR